MPAVSRADADFAKRTLRARLDRVTSGRRLDAGTLAAVQVAIDTFLHDWKRAGLPEPNVHVDTDNHRVEVRVEFDAETETETTTANAADAELLSRALAESDGRSPVLAEMEERYLAMGFLVDSDRAILRVFVAHRGQLACVCPTSRTAGAASISYVVQCPVHRHHVLRGLLDSRW